MDVVTPLADRRQAGRHARGAAVAADMRPPVTTRSLDVLRYDLTDIRRHNKESAA